MGGEPVKSWTPHAIGFYGRPRPGQKVTVRGGTISDLLLFLVPPIGLSAMQIFTDLRAKTAHRAF
jgi:hypothetical protein